VSELVGELLRFSLPKLAIERGSRGRKMSAVGSLYQAMVSEDYVIGCSTK
jgi:hypothetical protein